MSFAWAITHKDEEQVVITDDSEVIIKSTSETLLGRSFKKVRSWSTVTKVTAIGPVKEEK